MTNLRFPDGERLTDAEAVRWSATDSEFFHRTFADYLEQRARKRSRTDASREEETPQGDR